MSIYGPNSRPPRKSDPTAPGTDLGRPDRHYWRAPAPSVFRFARQINPQLPSDLGAGDQTLVVHAEDQPDATGRFTVQRNAPGLFYRQVGSKAYLVALHSDGSLATPKSPARCGERITALGTGFGPYQVQPLDGFAVLSSGTNKLADHTQLIFEGKIIEPEFAGAATGRVGMVAFRFPIADPLPVAATIEIKARVNGHESNTALLPLE